MHADTRGGDVPLSHTPLSTPHMQGAVPSLALRACVVPSLALRAGVVQPRGVCRTFSIFPHGSSCWLLALPPLPLSPLSPLLATVVMPASKACKAW
jgi:hypothetical protein